MVFSRHRTSRILARYAAVAVIFVALGLADVFVFGASSADAPRPILLLLGVAASLLIWRAIPLSAQAHVRPTNSVVVIEFPTVTSQAVRPPRLNETGTSVRHVIRLDRTPRPLRAVASVRGSARPESENLVGGTTTPRSLRPTATSA
jgi:hypothetical protein